MKIAYTYAISNDNSRLDDLIGLDYSMQKRTYISDHVEPIICFVAIFDDCDFLTSDLLF